MISKEKSSFFKTPGHGEEHRIYLNKLLNKYRRQQFEMETLSELEQIMVPNLLLTLQRLRQITESRRL